MRNTSTRASQATFAVLISLLKRGEESLSSAFDEPAIEAGCPEARADAFEFPASVWEEFPELVAKYGADRVTLSRSVAGQCIELVRLIQGEASCRTPDEDLPLDLRFVEPPLDASQEAAVRRAVAEFQKRKEEGAEEKCDMMMERQGEIMAHLLVADAYATGRIDGRDYRNLREEEDYRNLLNPLPGLDLSFDEDPMGDWIFLSQLQSMLTSEQRKTLRITQMEDSATWGMFVAKPLEEGQRWREDLIRSMKVARVIWRCDDAADTTSGATVRFLPSPQ